MKKKICFVTTTSITLKAFVVQTAEYLHDNGDYDITFICDNDNEFAASLPDYINYIPVLMNRGISLKGISAVFKLIKIFKANKFDLVQYSTPNASFYASIAAKRAKVPVRLYCQWGIRYVGMSGLTGLIFKKLENAVCKNSTDIRAVSLKNHDFAVNEGLYKREKAKVLGKGGTIGVDITNYDIENREEYNRIIKGKYGIGNEFVFGFVGRFSRDKGSNELLQAVKKITEQKNVRLLCIGKAEEENGVDKELYRWAKDSEQVIFTGQLENKDLKKFYAAMDCYVHPSYREGFGMVIQEAAAMGCAVITTDIPGASEVLENGISCILAEPRDPVSLEEKMRKVMNDANLCKNLGIKARERVEKYFDRRIMLETLRLDYEYLLKRGKG